MFVILARSMLSMHLRSLHLTIFCVMKMRMVNRRVKIILLMGELVDFVLFFFSLHCFDVG